MPRLQQTNTHGQAGKQAGRQADQQANKQASQRSSRPKLLMYNHLFYMLFHRFSEYFNKKPDFDMVFHRFLSYFHQQTRLCIVFSQVSRKIKVLGTMEAMTNSSHHSSQKFDFPRNLWKHHTKSGFLLEIIEKPVKNHINIWFFLLKFLENLCKNHIKISIDMKKTKQTEQPQTKTQSANITFDIKALKTYCLFIKTTMLEMLKMQIRWECYNFDIVSYFYQSF